jgi:hypothetical protein
LLERLEQYFEANEVDNTNKVSSLLILIGGKTYSLLRDLTFPDKPSTQTYDQLTQLLNNIPIVTGISWTRENNAGLVALYLTNTGKYTGGNTGNPSLTISWNLCSQSNK